MRIIAHDEDSMTNLFFSEVHRHQKIADFLGLIEWRSSTVIPFDISVVELHQQVNFSEFGKPDAIILATDSKGNKHVVVLEVKLGTYLDCCISVDNGKFNNKFNNKVYEAEFYRREKLFKRNKDFLVIHNRLAELNFVFVALVFGSYAKGTANKHSDIDILTIDGDEKEIKSAISLLPNKIHLTTLSCDEFIQMVKSKEFTVVSEALKNNIILIGKEEYYRLLSNAQKT